ncbi:glutamine synthetase family protein [Oceanicella sp. SM1341]|uniref:glutamine synthetase family protein n=1 Tax=Oceanicella sp. SM1341 TaxID=1548889 RepID=UPI000E4EDC77|nr:glutamine synthetase family protein [Oceanicella sp. SM1341]
MKLETLTKEEVKAVLDANPQIETIEMVFPDMNGVARGKHLPADQWDKLFGKVRMPVSLYNLDILSADVAKAGIAIERGDPDGYGHVAAFGPCLWTGGRRAMALMTMREPDGRPTVYDPRAVLARVAARYEERGLTPVIAPELEFYLMDVHRNATDRAQPPICPVTGERLHDPQVYRLSVQTPFSDILDEMIAAAKALDVNADVALAEFGPGQFEINLMHSEGALWAADQSVLLKLAIRNVAHRHGMEASFMAKPYGDQAGSGFHFHISVLDREGKNIFAGTSEGVPNAAMMGALGGMKRYMASSMLCFAPHLNSYRRFGIGTYAPAYAAWGLDNRSSAIRVPATTGAAARIEHRLAGADANPYLALAAILQAILDGMDENIDPGHPVRREAGPDDGPDLPLGWGRAILSFQEDGFMAHALGKEFARVYALMKEQEMASLNLRVTDVEYDVYLRAI